MACAIATSTEVLLVFVIMMTAIASVQTTCTIVLAECAVVLMAAAAHGH